MSFRPDRLDAPWGAFRPRGRDLHLLRLLHSMPANSFGKQAGGLLRRPMKYGPLRPLDVERWGQRLRLLTSGNVSGMNLLYLPQLLDPAERTLLEARMRPGATFVDIGANDGAYTFWVRSLIGEEGRIIAVEPDGELASRLRFNLRTNGVRNTVVLPYAISGEIGEGWLQISLKNRGENRLLQEPMEPEHFPEAPDSGSQEGARRIQVEVRTLLSALREVACGTVQAMKVDVEGMEESVLAPFFREAPESMWPDLLLMEFKEELAGHLRTRRLLEDLGYRKTLRTKLNLGLERMPR